MAQGLARMVSRNKPTMTQIYARKERLYTKQLNAILNLKYSKREHLISFALEQKLEPISQQKVSQLVRLLKDAIEYNELKGTIV